MRRTSLHPLLLFFLLLGLGGVAAAEEARDLFIRSLRDGGAVALTGEQVTTAGTGPARREVVQRIQRKANRVRIDFLAPRNIAGEVMVDDGQTYRLFLPRLRLMEQGESRLRQAERQNGRLLAAVQRGRVVVREEGAEAIAGRPARILAVAPPNGGPPRRFWIDRERAVVLKTEESGPRGQTASTTFTRIDFGAVPPDAAFILNPPGVQVVPDRLGRPIPLPRAQQLAQAWGGLYQPAALPPGYAFHAAFRTQIEQEPAIVLLYGNGQQGFTLFQGRRGGPPPNRTRGRPTVLARVLGDVTLTIVGPLPAEALQRVLDSVAR